MPFRRRCGACFLAVLALRVLTVRPDALSDVLHMHAAWSVRPSPLRPETCRLRSHGQHQRSGSGDAGPRQVSRPLSYNRIHGIHAPGSPMLSIPEHLLCGRGRVSAISTASWGWGPSHTHASKTRIGFNWTRAVSSLPLVPCQPLIVREHLTACL